MPLDSGETNYRCEHAVGDIDTIFFKLDGGGLPDEVQEAQENGAEVEMCGACWKALDEGNLPSEKIPGWRKMNQKEKWEALQAAYQRKAGRAA
jgi:hypothetical protein